MLEAVVTALAMGKTLPLKNKDHELSDDWAGRGECHIQPNWIFVYRIENDVLVLTLAAPGHTLIYLGNKAPSYWKGILYGGSFMLKLSAFLFAGSFR